VFLAGGSSFVPPFADLVTFRRGESPARGAHVGGDGIVAARGRTVAGVIVPYKKFDI
jgi:hypothetical protein